MKSYYIYFRLLYGLYEGDNIPGVSSARLSLQDILIWFRGSAARELNWTSQEVQDFFEGLVSKFKRMSLSVDSISPQRLDIEVGKRMVEKDQYSDYYGDERV
jgi:hypothetical protein